jgi:hypothetical protein
MRTEHHDQSSLFSKPTTWARVRASRVELIDHPGVDFAQLPLRVACALRLAESHEGAPRVRIDYFLQALWSASGGDPGWNDITCRRMRPEDDEAACALFAETEEEGFIIDTAISKLLGAEPTAAPVSPSAAEGGVP